MKKLFLIALLCAFSTVIFAQVKPDPNQWKHTNTHSYTKALNLMGVTLSGTDVTAFKKSVTDTVSASQILVYKSDTTGNAPGNYMTRQNYLYDAGNPNFLKIMQLNGSTDIAYPIGMYQGYSALPLADGVAQFALLYIPETKTLSAVKYALNTAGVYTPDNFNGFALYKCSTDSIRQVAITENDAVVFTRSAAPYNVNFITPYVASPGFYYLAVLANCNGTFSTAPSITTSSTIGSILSVSGTYKLQGTKSMIIFENAFLHSTLATPNSQPCLILR